ncbi:hypothetical protein [Microbacterium sp.]|uniref:hypothetical protein n=1 Tax=Microbacterium sp. TaxID=51671 RepID=UPI003C716E34
MAWVHLLTATADARAIMRRATATAKNLKKRARDGSVGDERTVDQRTRDQVRADLATAWLKGVGTPSAVKAKVFVTVPVDILAPAARATVRSGLPVPAGAPNLNEAARLDTAETIDRVTAVRMLLEAGSFTRVITDPVTGVVLDMDRKARAATRQQREWLLLTHGTCTRDGCARHAADSDVDHFTAFHGPGRGATDLANLHPFCCNDNQAKEKTRFRYRRRADGTTQLVSPTGYATASPPPIPPPPPAVPVRQPRPGELGARALLDCMRNGQLPPLPDDPPF